MRKKNGFVFVETMIVVVVLMATLLIIYSSYAGLISLERRKVRYDDPAFLYKTKIVADFTNSLYDEEGNAILKNKIEQNKNSKLTGNANFIVISPEDNELFGENNFNRQSFFSQLYNGLNIQSIIIINKENMGILTEDAITSDFYNYIQSIDLSEDDNKQYYFIVMYAEKVNGEACNPNELVNGFNIDNNTIIKQENKCTFYYSSIKIKEGNS